MRSLSYIIILVSLIGTCQSGKASCVPYKVKCKASNVAKNVSQEEAKQLLQEFNQLISKYNQKFSKAICSVDETSTFIFRFSSNFKELKSLKTAFDLIKKTSKIRNKDSLEDNILV
ncbi:hypothetical protein [Soonwooa sp.]|uniref:hypothetical protein n=1 Tax=Soonwooa sp. TaxID=1938592 RepID=UPI00289CF700|nr:hypothetical protein [Soonwooa sp.]